MKTIGIDFDGVIADASIPKLKYAKEVLGLVGLEKSVLKRDYFISRFGLANGDSLYTKMINALYNSSSMLEVPLVQGCIEGIQALQLLSWRCIIITSREGKRNNYSIDNQAGWAWEYIKVNKVPVNYEDFFSKHDGTKETLCLMNNAFGLVDDDYQKLHPVIRSGLKGFLFSSENNQHAENIYHPFDAVRIQNWHDLPKILENCFTQKLSKDF